MAQRAYGQYCGLARALDVVGERWALLIVRDLLVSPKRYTDLHNGLPRIPTNVLSSRLKQLEQAGVIRRRLLPRPAGSVVYELTEWGGELETVILPLGRWGARLLGAPRPEEIATVNSLILAMRSTFRPERANGLTVSYELRTGGMVVRIRVEDAQLVVSEGECPDADLVIETDATLKALMAGEVSPADALGNGSVRVSDGDPALLARFVELFRI